LEKGRSENSRIKEKGENIMIIESSMILVGFSGLTAFLSFVLFGLAFGQAKERASGEEEEKSVPEGSVRVTILYDNYQGAPGTEADWGFSCLVEGLEKTILFDTGARGDILLHNMKVLEVDINEIDQIVISHLHGDHTGGLASVLERNSKVVVYVPYSAPDSFVRRIQSAGARTVRVEGPEQIDSNVHLTGEMSGPGNEQSLIIDTSRGLVVITGCSHPGIVAIIKRAMEIIPKVPYAVFGGFHLGGDPESVINSIIRDFRNSGVVKCGACHCTGDRAINMFKKEYGQDFLPMGTGKVLEFPW